MLLPIIIATTTVGLIALIGVVFIFNKEFNRHLLSSIISLAAGALLATTFLDLLPEAIEAKNFEPHAIFATVLSSILFFFLTERIVYWHHCRCDDCHRQHTKDKKHLAYFNLAGDAIHNLIDGFLIASAFLLGFKTGMVVTVAVILHEIPQEISDFGVLIYAGFSKMKALIYNFSIALLAILGAIIFYFFGTTFITLIPLMAAFAAGNFIYLATADLIPELQHETDPKKIIVHSLWLIIGVLIIFLGGKFLPHG